MVSGTSWPLLRWAGTKNITTRTGTKYNVTWQDYDTGAPITAQMVAEKIDIGSMGDYADPSGPDGKRLANTSLAANNPLSAAGKPA